MGPRVFGAAIVQLNFWVNNNLGSKMAEGSIQSLTYGFTLMVMAQAAIAQSVAIAAMPTFSAQHALGKLDEMRSSLASALRGMLLLALPASVGLILLARPIVSMLFERGEFTATIAEMTAWALLWYAAGLVGHSIMEVLTRAFYAQQDTKTPVIIGTIAMGLNVVFSIWFSQLFAQIGWYPARRAGAGKLTGNRARSNRVVHLHAQTFEWHRRQIHCGWRVACGVVRAWDGDRFVVLDSGNGWDECAGLSLWAELSLEESSMWWES